MVTSSLQKEGSPASNDKNGKFLELIAGPDDLEANARASHESDGPIDSCHSGGIELATDSRGRIIALDRVTAEIHIFA